MKSGFAGRVLIFRNYLIFATTSILVLTFFARQYEFFSFDLYITLQIQQIKFAAFENLMMFLSWLGNFYQSLATLIIACLGLWYFNKKRLVSGLGISTLGAVAISEILKLIVSRPRPDSSLIHQVERFSKDDSFPSGHVLYFIGFYGFLLFLSFTLIKSKLWRNLVSGILLLMIILIGVSRIYIGSHWFSDTLGSYLIGSVWLYIVVLIFRKLGTR